MMIFTPGTTSKSTPINNMMVEQEKVDYILNLH